MERENGNTLIGALQRVDGQRSRPKGVEPLTSAFGGQRFGLRVSRQPALAKASSCPPPVFRRQ